MLSNAEKRQEYDSQFVRPRHPGAGQMQRDVKRKQYTDLDIDFEDLEHFQRMAKLVFSEFARRFLSVLKVLIVIIIEGDSNHRATDTSLPRSL